MHFRFGNVRSVRTAQVARADSLQIQIGPTPSQKALLKGTIRVRRSLFSGCAAATWGGTRGPAFSTEQYAFLWRGAEGALLGIGGPSEIRSATTRPYRGTLFR
jgi:hypothetical protein